ncbi:MFS transporter [Staphylococcus caprae]|uniref:MFS transporter n=1 Tax=Staphylococcus caprae TaxID=29380 RepID=UPI001C12129F|nr:MFS transporter [Staphylococcus caprae]MBU5271846.1 MFS transporter [Staphylococcus caprae]
MSNRTSNYLIVILSLGYVMAVLDTTGVVLALPHIENNLNIDLNNSIWIINIYILALGSFLLLSGSLTNKYGSKLILIIGMVLFTLASLGCMISINFEMLTFFRFLQGIGATLFMPSSLALIYIIFPNKEKRASMLGIWTTIISVATGTGSFIGGTIVNLLGWRGIFLINIPLGIVTLFSVMLLINKNIKSTKTKIDLVGHLLLIISISSLVIFLIEGNRFGYLKLSIILCLVLSFTTILILIIQQNFSNKPIIPTNLLKSTNFLIPNIIGLIINISLYGIVLVLGLYYQKSLGMSAVFSGLLILPAMIILVIGNITYTKLIKVKPLNYIILISMAIILFACIIIPILINISDRISLVMLVIMFSTMNYGIGILTPAITTLLINNVEKQHIGIAGASLNANKQIGGLFGTSLMSVIVSLFNNDWNSIILMTFILIAILYFLIFIISFKYFKYNN